MDHIQDIVNGIVNFCKTCHSNLHDNSTYAGKYYNNCCNYMSSCSSYVPYSEYCPNLFWIFFIMCEFYQFMYCHLFLLKMWMIMNFFLTAGSCYMNLYEYCSEYWNYVVQKLGLLLLVSGFGMMLFNYYYISFIHIMIILHQMYRTGYNCFVV